MSGLLEQVVAKKPKQVGETGVVARGARGKRGTEKDYV